LQFGDQMPNLVGGGNVTLIKHYEFGENCLTCGLTLRTYPLKN
jgi:hypothetical protein